MAAQANAGGSDRYDIGRVIKKTERGEELTDKEREAYLSERWVPKRRDEYPFSEKKNQRTSSQLVSPRQQSVLWAKITRRPSPG